MEESLAIDGRPLELHYYQKREDLDDLERDDVDDEDYDFKILM